MCKAKNKNHAPKDAQGLLFTPPPSSLRGAQRRGNPDEANPEMLCSPACLMSGLPRRAAPRNDGLGCEQ